MLETFKAIAGIACGAKARRDEEHGEFLTFFRGLVEVIPSEAADLFGNIGKVRTRVDGEIKNYGIELSATDYLWWKREIGRGARLVAGVEAVKLDMLERLSKVAEAQKLTLDERKALLALLDSVE